MAQDSEKKFNSIMDKLFSTPKSKPTSSSSPGAQVVGPKRPNPTANALALGEQTGHTGSSQAPLCRPWDRGDLMRRLATFKSMTWFAKPQVVSAVNCARRGWVNIDMDTITCEACGARMLFSTPSSWTQQQVEKAALVFSLKLDTGHKLLCPWIDNICDETLAEFPPTTPPVLVDKFRDRSSMLLQLLSLPVVSSSAIQAMRSSQLEDFLKRSPLQECSNGSLNSSLIGYFNNESDVNSAKFYYQALNLISLCGWEPRSLPYVVECEDKLNQSVKDAVDSRSSHGNGNNQSIVVHSGGTSEIVVNENSDASAGREYDAKSVVLDCKLCGASVGLWAFSLVPRPMELFRLVGNIEPIDEERSRDHDLGLTDSGDKGDNATNTLSVGATLMNDRSSNLNLTIAGGPPPTRQNFKATISLPIIGQNLRARIARDADFKNYLYSMGGDIESISKDKNLNQGGRSHDGNKNGDTQREISDTMQVEGRNVAGQGTEPENVMNNSVLENSTECTKVTECSSQSVIMPGIAEGTGSESPATKNLISQVDSSLVTIADENITTRNGETDGKIMDVNKESSCSIEGSSNVCSTLGRQSNGHERNGVKEGSQAPINNEIMACSAGRDIMQQPTKAMEFDPFRQHRHFCPWIASSDGGSPGWQQTLSALLRVKDVSQSSPSNSSPGSLIKVDDPLTSIRKLFTSPGAKRMKHSHGSG